MVEWVGAFPHYQWVAGMFSVGRIEVVRDDPEPGAGPCPGRVPIRDLLLKFRTFFINRKEQEIRVLDQSGNILEELPECVPPKYSIISSRSSNVPGSMPFCLSVFS